MIFPQPWTGGSQTHTPHRGHSISQRDRRPCSRILSSPFSPGCGRGLSCELCQLRGRDSRGIIPREIPFPSPAILKLGGRFPLCTCREIGPESRSTSPGSHSKSGQSQGPRPGLGLPWHRQQGRICAAQRWSQPRGRTPRGWTPGDGQSELSSVSGQTDKASTLAGV